jgi:hypothetical protein
MQGLLLFGWRQRCAIPFRAGLAHAREPPAEVSEMREELRLMAARLAARDQAMQQHLQVKGKGGFMQEGGPGHRCCVLPSHPDSARHCVFPRPMRSAPPSPALLSSWLVAGFNRSNMPPVALNVLPSPQTLEAAQLESHREALSEARAAQRQLLGSYAALRDAFLAVHAALSPHNLGVALGFRVAVAPSAPPATGVADAAAAAAVPGRLSLGPEAYEALTARLLAAREVVGPDADAVVGRVREVLAQVGGACGANGRWPDGTQLRTLTGVPQEPEGGRRLP